MTEHGNLNARLDSLLRAYRAAFPDPQPGPDFMPGIWRKIEARQSFSFFLGRMARTFVTAAIALSFAMAAYVFIPYNNAKFYSQTYVELLADRTGDLPDLDDALPANEAGLER